jgi:shikimate kinase
MILKLKRTPGIYLVGFMGCGKSTVGRMLADQIGWHFADTDDDIETDQNTTITNLFATIGEPEFRSIETEAIRRRVRRIQAGLPMVISIGGGAFTQPVNVDLINNNGVSIWLDTAFPIVKKRVDQSTHRPLARDPERFQQLYEHRRHFYALADYRIEIIEDDSRLALEAVMALPIFH